MNHFYSLIILICLAGSGISQVNSYFNNNPCWQVKEECHVGTNCYLAKVFNYMIDGDTVIGPYQYKKVYTKGTQYYQCYCPVPPPSSSPCFSPGPPVTCCVGLSFFIRSNGKKMYLRNLGSGSPDTLLYDFNLVVGDTLPPTYNNFSSNVIKVTAIDSINTFNGWMKRFQLSGNTVSPYLVEGMGHYQGLKELISPNVMSCGWSLLCYSQNNTAYYPSSGPSCLLSVGIKETEQTEKPIIYPNPSTGIYQLQTTRLPKNLKIEIYNSLGQLVYFSFPQKENIEIDLRKEKDGIYFLKYISNGETRSVKLLKE